jgi:hypothetical protein
LSRQIAQIRAALAMALLTRKLGTGFAQKDMRPLKVRGGRVTAHERDTLLSQRPVCVVAHAQDQFDRVRGYAEPVRDLGAARRDTRLKRSRNTKALMLYRTDRALQEL